MRGSRKFCQRGSKFDKYVHVCLYHAVLTGPRSASVTCLATDACLTADPGVASSIPARSHTFVEIDHEMISTVILLPSAEEGLFVSYKRKYVHKLLVNRLFHTGQCKSTGGCYNELVVAYFGTGGGVKWRKW